MKLLGTEQNGALTEKTWLHTDANGDDVFTTETSQDAAPVIETVKRRSQTGSGKEFKYKADIPLNTMNDICYKTAVVWGTSAADVMQELVLGKTDRAKQVWRLLTESRDYRKLQAKNY